MQEDVILISTLIISIINLGHLLGFLLFLIINGICDKIKRRKVINNMKRIKKINFLLSKGEIIDYHYNNYTYQRRLIIDRINELEYHNTVGDQKLAAKMIDSMCEEYINDHMMN